MNDSDRERARELIERAVAGHGRKNIALVVDYLRLVNRGLAAALGSVQDERECLRAQADRDYALAAEWKAEAERWECEAFALRDRLAALQPHAPPAADGPGAAERGDDPPR